MTAAGFLLVAGLLAAEASATPSEPGRSAPSRESARLTYLALQVPLSTALYGVALPWALDAGGLKTRIATPLIVAPFAFGAHLWIARSFPFTPAHQAGTSYLSLAAIYAGMALPASLIDDHDVRWRASAWTSMALYPLGVYGGYLLGDAYAEDVDRIATQARFALGFGLLGFFTPLLYFEDFGAHQEAIWRLGLAQSVGLAGMGHFISRYQPSGPQAPGGFGLGLFNHTALGMAAGLTFAAWADAESVRPWLGGAVLGGTLGFMEGLWFFHGLRDSRERSFYTSLGLAAGAVAGGGLALLTWDEDASGYHQRVATASLLAGGALLGYAATYALTRGMQDLAARKPAESPHGWAWQFLPIPLVQPETSTDPRSGRGTLSWRYQVPGFIAHF